MADPVKHDDDKGGKTDRSGDAELSARLKTLGARLGHATKREFKEKSSRGGLSMLESTALGRAMRLPAEFAAGVLAGVALGWLIDRLLGTTPWGLIVFVVLGFCAGILNLLRAIGKVKPSRFDDER